jgi:hypothetical protein
MRRKNGGSNIPLARSLLTTALAERDWRYVKKALSLMTRASPVRRAPPTHMRINGKQRAAVIALKHSDLTMHQIANKVGLANGGRVSEIMTDQ